MKRLPMMASIGLLMATMATPSLAADLPAPSYKAPIYSVPLYNWTGFYLGINGGYAWGSAQWTGGAGNFESSPKGWMAGGTIGYNLQTGTWVWGLEADLDYLDLNGTTDSAFCPSCSFKSTWLATGRGRLGYSFDRFLPYLTGGVAYGNMKVSTPIGDESKTKAGWTVGAGLEYALAGNWTTKVEYLYVDLGSMTCGMASCGGATDATIDVTANIVRAGLNYRF